MEKGVKTMDFNGHAGDIAGLSLSPDMKTYITGSVDKTAKLWDVREQGHKQMFFGHDMDVSSVCVSPSSPTAIWLSLICSCLLVLFQYHPSGFGFASCSEDQTARLYDLRADQQIGLYEPNKKNTGFTSCGAYLIVFVVVFLSFTLPWLLTIPNLILCPLALSTSGRYLLCAGIEGNIHSWDTMKQKSTGRWRAQTASAVTRIDFILIICPSLSFPSLSVAQAICLGTRIASLASACAPTACA